MDDDVLFLVPGKEPFGKEEFAATSKQMANVRMKGTSEIKEIEIVKDWAWMRTFAQSSCNYARWQNGCSIWFDLDDSATKYWR